MPGLGQVLSIAKDALAAQQLGISITGHNIANVNTEGYSRQRAVYEAKEPVIFGGLFIGRGVDAIQIIRTYDQFIEKQLMEQKSSMLASKEMENYMQVLEGLFNENTEMSISTMLADFWNRWHDIANNPSGAPERIALYEHGILLSEQLNTLDADLTQLETDLTNAVSAGIENINLITAEIAKLNDQITGLEASGTANDLRDKRNALVSELGEYLEVKAFEQSNGSLTIVTAKGCILNSANSSYDLQLTANAVEWVGSGGNRVDFTNYLSDGKLGGWLEMRDEIIAKYKLDLDAVTEEFIWTVNEQHSQGVGLQFFSSAVTGTYKTGSSGLLDTLSYGNKIDYDKDFKMWTYDSNATSPVPVAVDMAVSTANPTWGGAGNFAVADTTYTIEVTQGGTVGTDAIQFSWSEPKTPNSDTETMASAATTVAIDGKTLTFSAGDVLVAGNTLKINTVAAGAPKPMSLTPTDTANDISDTYTFTVTTGGTIGTDTLQIDWSNSTTSGTFSLTAATTTVTVDGMTLPFTVGDYLYADDVFTITTDENGTPTASVPSDWHWTLDSFINQFNRQTPRVIASKTSDDALKFAPDTTQTQRELTTFGYDSGVTAANTTITVNNYDRLTDNATDFQLERTGVDTWVINNAGAYAATAVLIPAGGDDSGFGVDLNGDGSSDITVSFATDVTTDGYVEFDIELATGTYSFGFSDDTAQDSGLMAALGINTFFQGSSAGSIGVNTVLNNKNYIAAAQIDATTGDLAAGNNKNARAIADLQYTKTYISEWTVDRIIGNTEEYVNATIENRYHSMVGSIGIKSASISRGRAFNEVMYKKLGEVRDGLSAVSLDEEMTKLMEFQHAYAAAAKLISVSDEMLNTLLSVK